MNITPITPIATPSPISLIIRNREARADSRQLAEYLGLKHRSVFQTVNDHLESFEKLGKVRFENAASVGSLTGQRVRFALLSEDQAYLLLTMSRNTPRVVDLKVALVMAFRDSRLALATYQSATLPSFKALQDCIHAVPGGAGPWLHSNVNKLVNMAAAVAAGSRTTCTATQQALLSLMQGVAAKAIQEAADAKDAYVRCKAALSPFGSLASI